MVSFTLYAVKFLLIYRHLQNTYWFKCEEQAPSFLMVLTATGGAYQREDGVYVAPINLLKP